MKKLRIVVSSWWLGNCLLCACLMAGVDVHAQGPTLSSFSPTSATAGAGVTVNGTNLSNVTEVRFGGTPCGYFFVFSNAQLIAFPDTGSTGAIEVISSFGNASINGFTYLYSPVVTSFSPASGGYGTQLTIKGKHFSPDIFAVYIGDSAAVNFSVTSDTSIIATVANGSSGDVLVLSPNGTGSVGGFIYTGPVIDSFTPTSGSANTQVTITGQNFTGIQSVLFGNSAASQFNVVSPTQISATTSSNAAGDVVVIGSNGTAVKAGFNIPLIYTFFPDSGTRGDTISINGINLSGTTNVWLGDSSAAFTRYGDTLLKVVVGTGSSGLVKVTTNLGTTYSNGYFSYIPTITQLLSFSPTAAGKGDTILLSGLHFTGVSGVSFGGTPARSFTVTNDQQIKAVVANGSTGLIRIIGPENVDSLGTFTFLVRVPAITQVTPLSAIPGSIITLHGNYFSPVPNENTVYIGSVKANVVTAGSNQLQIVVPKGATYQPISVTVDSLTGYSRLAFIPSFSNTDSSFTASAYRNELRLTSTGSNPEKVVAADFDNDGKNDLALVYGYFGSNNNKLSVYRNTSINGSISFAAPLDWTVGTQSFSGYDVQVADFNGDGKLDLLVLSSGDNTANLLMNQSTPGNLQFAVPVPVVVGSDNGPEGTNPVHASIADLNKDGKPDIVVANFGLDNWCKVSVLRNTSAGSLSFAAPQNYVVVDAYSVTAGNLSADQLPDIAVAVNVNGSFMKQVAILHNNSTMASISFSRDEDAGAQNSIRSHRMAIGDLDGDGQPDLALANNNTYSISLLKNTTVGNGLISLASNLEIPVNNSTSRDIAIADVNGDGKPDLVIGSINTNKASVFINQSTAGNLSFANEVTFAVGVNPAGIAVADLNNDGKPEIITANQGDTSLSILKSYVGGAVELCPAAANLTLTSNATGASYQWLMSTDSIHFNNLANNLTYSGVNTATLQINQLPSSADGVQFKCAIGTGFSSTYTVQFVNYWTGAVNNDWSNPGNWSCGTLPDSFTQAVIRNGTVQVNNQAVCKSLKVLPGATVTVNTGGNIIVQH